MAKAVGSGSASISIRAISGNGSLKASMTCLYWAATASLLVWAKIVETRAPAGLERAEPSLEVMVRAKWTRQRCQAAPGRIALTAALMPACASLVTSTTPVGSSGEGTLSPRSRRDRRKDVQKSVVSASPRAMPRISRRPSADTPVATTRARQTTRCPTLTSRYVASTNR